MGFVELGAAVGVADAAIEFDTLGFDGGDDGFFAYQGGAGFEGLLEGGGGGGQRGFLVVEGWKEWIGGLSN